MGTMSERPRITLKINIFHDVRDAEKDVSKIEDKLVQYLEGTLEDACIELQDDVSGGMEDKRLSGTRIAVGHRASAVFVELAPRRFSEDSIERVVRRTVKQLGHSHYAENVELDDYYIEATEPGARTE